MRQWISNRSFRYKLMVAAVACILMPTCVTFIMYNYLTQSAVKEQAIANSQESMQLVSNYVNTSMKYMLNVANSIQMDSEINTIMKNRVSGEPFSGPEAEYKYFNDTDKILKKIDNITIGGERVYVTILLENGRGYFANYSFTDYDPVKMRDEPWFNQQLKSIYGLESYWIATPTIFHSEENPFQISVARTLRGTGLSIFGYVVVTINENQVNQNFERLAETQEFMILDQNNVIVSHNDSSRIGQPFPYLTEGAQKNSTSIIKMDDENYLMTHETLALNGWKIVSLMPYKKAVTKINSIFHNVFLLQMISFVLFLLLFVYLLRTFTKPLVKLGKTALAVQRGNLEIRTDVKGGDEIGRLGLLFDQMLDRINEMIVEISATQARKRKAELAMLQAQINPHFLFNVLNSIRMKVMLRGDKESAEMLGSLSKLLRMTIEQERSTISLHEEVEIVIDYMKLMNMRQKNKAQLEADISADAFLEKVPRFVLQPLIENALIHGLSQSGGTISLRAWVTGKKLVIVVEDDGIGIAEETLRKLRSKLDSKDAQGQAETKKGFSSIGLSNVNERMRMTYGDQFRMRIQSEPDKGTRILMSIPRTEATETNV